MKTAIALRYLLPVLTVMSVVLQTSRTSARVDGTLTPNRNGSSVVKAVIAKIDASKIFAESNWWKRGQIERPLVWLFLRRMAYVETRDGSILQPGGIWNVSRAVFDETRTRVCDSSSQQVINSETIEASSILNTSWCNVSYGDMSVPMYSGVAIALQLDELLTNPGRNVQLPTNAWRLHMLWRHFNSANGRNTSMWITGVNELKMKEQCSIKSDVVFVIDSSISITPHDYKMTKALIYNFTGKMYETSNNRVGVILIGTEADERKRLDEILTEENLNTTLEVVSNLPHLQGFTNTADGLCTLSRQEWRDDGGVLKLAIVLTDGVSNRNSDNCGGSSTEEMANLIRTNISDVLVFAIGVGAQINEDELEVIASRSHLTSHVTNYEQLPSMPETLHYQICSTMSTQTGTENQENGTLAKNEIMRWVLNGVGGEGVTVRLCVRGGGITLYVSQVTTPNEEIHDSRSNIARTHKLAIVCETIFNTQYHTPGTRRPRSSEPGGTTSLYLSIEGHDEMNTFFMQSGDGNVTFDVNECRQHPSPCHESALCYNTDGSFYCECRQGYKGDGFHCSSYLFELVAFLIPSVVLGVLLLLGFVLLAIVGIRLNCSAPKAPPKGKRVPTPFTSAGSCSATNPLAINTPA